MPAIETERFLVSRDTEFRGKWLIVPLAVSELWKLVLGDHWDITWSSAPEFSDLYEACRFQWESGSMEHGEDILICEVEVEYSFDHPPGVRALRPGRHVWSDSNQFWYIVGRSDSWKIVGGFVRTVKMSPLTEGSHLERREARRAGSYRAATGG